MILLVNIAGILLLVFIVWWFWLTQSESFHATEQVINIKVSNGVYAPARIEIAKDQDVILRFHRLDASTCAENVHFHGLGIHLELPLNEVRDVLLNIETPGEYRFTCDMEMYQGTLIVN